MDPRTNPYSPGAGLRPPFLVGRDGDTEAFEIMADRAQNGLASRSIVFSGLRGVGKTVLLVELAGRARERDWLVVQVEAEHSDPGYFASVLASQMANAVRRRRSWMGRATDKIRDAVGTIASFQAAVGVSGISLDVDRERGLEATGSIEYDLVGLAETTGAAAKEEGVGVVLLIDEMQDLTNEQMSAVCRACHQAGQQQLPWFIVGAGLPNLPTRLAESESYAERLFEYRAVSRLSDDAARSALLGPATDQSIDWNRDAAQFVVDESGGYPYFLQQFGKTVWDLAAGPDSITLDDAVVGVAEGQQELDVGFYLSRWERATKAEREFLRAMADDNGEPSRVADIVDRLGKADSRSIGPARAKLISKGIVYAPEHGEVAYTVPGMADYVRRREPEG